MNNHKTRVAVWVLCAFVLFACTLHTSSKTIEALFISHPSGKAATIVPSVMPEAPEATLHTSSFLKANGTWFCREYPNALANAVTFIEDGELIEVTAQEEGGWTLIIVTKSESAIFACWVAGY